MAVDPTLSVYQLIKRSRQASIILRNFQELDKLGRKIEHRLIESAQGGICIAGFGVLSRFETHRARYEQIAERVEHVYIVSYPDVAVAPIDNLTFVHIEWGHALLREHFVLFHGSDYYTAIAAPLVDEHSEKVALSPLWTFDLDIIRIIADWLLSDQGVRVALLPETAYDDSNHAEFMDADVDYYLEISENDE